MVAAAVAGEPMALTASATPLAGGVGAGLNGMTDPSEVGASGRLNEDDRIGDDLLDGADSPDDLLQLGGEEPTGSLGIPGIMLEAYMQAADTLATMQPNCNLDWSLVAAIGKIESGHARGGRVDTEGNTTPNILGPVLNGGGFAAIRDTDGGQWDGDAGWDRAVGAMQFIPSTWQGYAADGNGDGVKSPHNVFDSTVAAGKYLCSGGLDLSNPQDRATAVFRYNHSDSYVATVLLWADAYAEGGAEPLPTDLVPEDDDIYALGPPSIGNDLPVATQPGTTPASTPVPNPSGNPPPGTSGPGTPLPTQVSPTKSPIPTTTPTTPCTPAPTSTTTTTTTTTESTSETTGTPEPTPEPTPSTTPSTSTTTPLPPC